MPAKVVLTVMPRGPLKVQNASTIRYCGEQLATQGDAYLCRCGESKNAPFCDSSHKTNGFSDANESLSQPELRVWEGNTLRTFFNSKTCMHVFHCKPLAELREKEMSGDLAAAQDIMQVIRACPSGALSYELKDGAPGPAVPTPECDIDIIEGGEIRIQVDFSINHELHERQQQARATLCRCGLSKNKPYCDGRHKGRVAFR